MIRGIILLILSCVVLNTFATDSAPYCTCNDNPKPVYEQADNYYPTEKIVYEEPEDCADLQKFCDEVSVVNLGWLIEMTTDLIGELLITVEKLLLDLVKKIEWLVKTKIAFLLECDLINGIIRLVFDDILLLIDSDCHRDPFCACGVVPKMIAAKTKMDKMEQTKTYLDSALALAESKKELVTAQKDICGKFKTVSEEVDNRQKNCGGHSALGIPLLGGALGGLTGGLLGGCDRENIISGLLSTVLHLLGQVLDLVTRLLKQVLIDVNNLISALQLFSRHREQIMSTCNFDQITEKEVLADKIIEDTWKPTMTKLQNQKCLSFEDVYQNCANIMKDDKKKELILETAAAPINDFHYSGCTMTCSDSKGNDLSLGVNINILNLVKISLDLKIFIFIEFKLDVIVDVNVGRTLEKGCEDYMKSVTLLITGLTGCNAANPTIVEIDAALGIAKVKIEIDSVVHNTMCSPVLGVGEVTPENILPKVPALVEKAKSSACESCTDVESWNKQIPVWEQQITDMQGEIKNKDTSIEKQIQEIQNMPTGKGGDDTVTYTDITKMASETVKEVNDGAAYSKKECEIALENCERSILSVNLKIALCQKQLVEARAKVALEPNNQALIDACVALEAQLDDLLHECIYLKLSLGDIKLKLEVQLGVHVELLDLCAKLSVNIDALELGICALVPDLKVYLNVDVNLEELVKNLNCLLPEICPTIESLVCTVDKTVTKVVKTVENVIVPVVKTVDGVVHTVGDVVNDVIGTDCLAFVFDIFDDKCQGSCEDTHKQYIAPAVAACCKNSNVYVTPVPKPKTDDSNKYSYNVYVTDAEPVKNETKSSVKMATQENGMSAQTAATSSASSLVVSFFILFVSVLCFF